MLPASTLLPSPAPVFRTTFRVWDLNNMSIIKTFNVGEQQPAGQPAMATWKQALRRLQLQLAVPALAKVCQRGM